MKLVRNSVIALSVLLVVGFCALPRVADRTMNAVERPETPFATSPAARAFHAELRIADLHADPLLWPRDILARGDAGQVDVPRLIEGRVVLQVFGVATQSPWGLNFERNSAEAFDMNTPLSIASGWSPRTYTSRLARALTQAELLRNAAAGSGGKLALVAGRADLAAHLEAHARDPQRTAAFLGLEGMHALDGRVESLDALHAAGFRMVGFAHFFDNPFAGSSAGEEKHGLTELGRAAVKRMGELSLIADLAHASPATIRDVLALATRPVVVSHTGVQATCPGPRNLSDDEIRAIAANGGVIGIGAFAGAVCDTAPRAVARAMKHVRDLVGIEHVALGSDFDGAVTTAFDISETPVLVDALLAEGFSPEEVRLALGENTLALIAKLLPE
ncbi:MAG: membrane dipeptidase [Deltaproteobacteria bacterium]|nr:membrane dipeptidase [Deltaproteobacteria bacterium]